MTANSGSAALGKQSTAEETMTTKRELTEEENVQAALQFLDHSDREFAAGDVMQGSEKLWGAASHAVMAIAKKRGWPYAKYNARSIAVGRLAQEYDDNSLVPSFSVARKFHTNFYRDTMEDDEIAQDRPIVHAFVRRILSMVEERAS